MNMKDVLLSASIAKSSAEEVWEDVCDITLEEEASSIYQELGASYKKLRIYLGFKRVENDVGHIFVFGNSAALPGNTDRCQIAWYPNSKQTGTVYSEFSNEVIAKDTLYAGNVYFRKDYTTDAFCAMSGMSTPKCGFANDSVQGTPYTSGIHSILVWGLSISAFAVGTKLVVKGVRA